LVILIQWAAAKREHYGVTRDYRGDAASYSLDACKPKSDKPDLFADEHQHGRQQSAQNIRRDFNLQWSTAHKGFDELCAAYRNGLTFCSLFDGYLAVPLSLLTQRQMVSSTRH